MARVKRAVHSKKKRRVILERAQPEPSRSEDTGEDEPHSPRAYTDPAALRSKRRRQDDES